MLDNNQTTEIYSRTLRRTDAYLTVEGPYKGNNDFSVLAGLIAVIGMVAVIVWRWIC
jgi:hypothetical protein